MVLAVFGNFALNAAVFVDDVAVANTPAGVPDLAAEYESEFEDAPMNNIRQWTTITSSAYY